MKTSSAVIANESRNQLVFFTQIDLCQDGCITISKDQGNVGVRQGIECVCTKITNHEVVELGKRRWKC